MGGSNGGLLVGACINQAPEFFGAAICQAGILDMLHFNKFTIGWAWSFEYGSPDSPEAFKHIIKYFPLHNVRVPRTLRRSVSSHTAHHRRSWRSRCANPLIQVHRRAAARNRSTSNAAAVRTWSFGSDWRDAVRALAVARRQDTTSPMASRLKK